MVLAEKDLDWTDRAIEFEKGDHILGPSGCGKSTILSPGSTWVRCGPVPRAEWRPGIFLGSTTTIFLQAPNDQAGQDAFAVIREATRDKGMVALARIVLAKRERVIMLQPWDKGLMGTTLHYRAARAARSRAREIRARKANTSPVNAAFDQGCWRRRPRSSTAAASSVAPIARAPSSPRTGISLKWKSATSVPSPRDKDQPEMSERECDLGCFEILPFIPQQWTSNSGSGCQALHDHPCRAHCSLRGRGMPSA
jgi:hypothetical protein